MGFRISAPVKAADDGAAGWCRPFVRHHRAEYLVIVLGQASVMIAAVLSVTLLTRIMPVEEYGRLGLAMTVIGTLGMLSFAPIGQVVDRFAPVHTEGADAERFSAATLVVFASLALVVVLVITTMGPRLLDGAGLGISMSLLAWSACFSILAGALVLLVAYLNARRRRFHVALVQGGDAWLRLGCAAFGLWCIAETASSAVVGYIAGSVITLGVSLVLLAAAPSRPLLNLRLDKASPALIASMLKYAWPFSIAALFSALGLYADRWVINHQMGALDVGIYFAMVQFATAVVTIIAGPLIQYIQPAIYRSAGDAREPTGVERSRRALYASATLLAITIAVLLGPLVFFGPVFLELLMPHQYSVRGDLLWLVFLGVGLFQVAQVLAIVAQLHRRPEQNIIPKMLHGITMVTLGFLLARWLGFAGVCLALAVSSLVYLGAVLHANKAFS